MQQIITVYDVHCRNMYSIIILRLWYEVIVFLTQYQKKLQICYT